MLLTYNGTTISLPEELEKLEEIKHSVEYFPCSKRNIYYHFVHIRYPTNFTFNTDVCWRLLSVLSCCMGVFFWVWLHIDLYGTSIKLEGTKMSVMTHIVVPLLLRDKEPPMHK